MSAALSFVNAPPLRLPLHFFLAAPVYLLLAAVGLAASGADDWQRWSPLMLAQTHLLTLGFLGNVMLGAFIQLAAVLAGVAYPRPDRLLLSIFWPWQLGSLALVSGLYTTHGVWLQLAGPVLLVACLALLLQVGAPLWRSPTRDASSRGLRWALPGLLLTVLLGGALTLWLGWGVNLPVLRLLPLHIVAGSLLWQLLLLASVALTVTPMFQLTPPYPKRWSQWAAPAIVLTALAWGGFSWLAPAWAGWGSAAPWLTAAVFAVLTLRLQGQSRRPQDVSRRGWQIAMGGVLLALLLWLAALCWPALAEQRAWPLWLAMAWFWLGAGTAVVAMLFKIVPFLAWLHLQNGNAARLKVPNMKQLIGARSERRQLWLWGLAALAWGAAALQPATWSILSAAGVLLLAAGHLLGVLGYASWRYWRCAAEVAAAAAMAQPRDRLH